MLSVKSRIAFSVLVLAACVGLTACSQKEGTSLLVDVTLDKLVTPQPDKVTFVVSRDSSTFASQHVDWPATSAGTLEVALTLPAEAAGIVNLDVQAWLKGAGVPIAAASPSPTTAIVADKVNGPLPVTLTPVSGGGDAGTDAWPNDGLAPDLAGGPETGGPDAGATPDTRSDGSGPEAAALDAPAPPDVVQPVDGLQSVDGPQPVDGLQPVEVAPSSPDAPQGSDVADARADAVQAADTVEAGEDTGADSSAKPFWHLGADVVNDPLDYASDSVVAVDPVHDHVYVMWIDWPSSAVRVRRWDAIKAKWGDTYTLEDNPNGNPNAMQIGVDGSGKVVAVWFHSDPSDTTLLGVRSSQSTDGISWSTPARITPNRQVAEASMAVARNGTARLAFTERDSSNNNVPLLYSAYYDGNTWTAGPDALDSQPNISSPPYPNPSVAISDQGGIILFTQKDNQLNDSVAVATFAGPDLNPYTLLDSNVSNDIDERAVVMNRNGQGAVVWSDNGAILSSYSPSTKTWTTPKKIGNVGLSQPTMAMASDGTITLAWSLESSLSFFNVWTMEGTAGGTWTTPTALESDNLSVDVYFLDAEFGPLPSPTLAIDGTDNVLLVWSKKTQATPIHEFAVYGRSKPAGSAGVWQPATELARKPLQPWTLSLGVSDKGLGAAGFYWQDPYNTNDPASAEVFVSFFR